MDGITHQIIKSRLHGLAHRETVSIAPLNTHQSGACCLHLREEGIIEGPPNGVKVYGHTFSRVIEHLHYDLTSRVIQNGECHWPFLTSTRVDLHHVPSLLNEETVLATHMPAWFRFRQDLHPFVHVHQ